MNRGSRGKKAQNNINKVFPGIEPKQINYQILKRKKHGPRIQEQYYNEFESDAFANK